MKSKNQGSGGIQGMEWIAGSVVVLLLVGAGLPLLAQQALGKEASEASAAAFLLALYLASWAYVLGLVGLLVLSVRWLGNWRHATVDGKFREGYLEVRRPKGVPVEIHR